MLNIDHVSDAMSKNDHHADIESKSRVASTPGQLKDELGISSFDAHRNEPMPLQHP